MKLTTIQYVFLVIICTEFYSNQLKNAQNMQKKFHL